MVSTLTTLLMPCPRHSISIGAIICVLFLAAGCTRDPSESCPTGSDASTQWIGCFDAAPNGTMRRAGISQARFGLGDDGRFVLRWSFEDGTTGRCEGMLSDLPAWSDKPGAYDYGTWPASGGTTRDATCSWRDVKDAPERLNLTFYAKDGQDSARWFVSSSFDAFDGRFVAAP